MGNKYSTYRPQSVSKLEGGIRGIKYNTCRFQLISKHVQGIKGRSHSIYYRDQNILHDRQRIDTTLLCQYISECKREIERNYSTYTVQDISQVEPGVRGRSHKVLKCSEYKQKYTQKGKRQYHCANNLAHKTHTNESHPYHENGVCGIHKSCMLITNRYNFVINRYNFVRGEIFDSQIISDDFKGKENNFLHAENTRPKFGEDKEIDSDDNTKRKLRVKSYTDYVIPRIHIAEKDVTVGILKKVNRSINLQESYQDGCFYQRKRNGLENEKYKNCASQYGSIGHRESPPQVSVSDISDNESDFEFSNDLDTYRQSFVTHCDALFQHLSRLEIGKGSHESINCIESDDHCFNHCIGDTLGDSTCARCVITIPHSNLVNSESTVSSFHNHSCINKSEGSVEGFVLERSRQELLCCMESTRESSNNEFSVTKYVFNLEDRSVTKPEPFRESLTNEFCINHFLWNTEDDTVSEENKEGSPVNELTNGCQNDDSCTACHTFAVCIPESFKYSDDDAIGKRHLISSAWRTKSRLSVNLESLGENMGHRKSDLSEEKEKNSHTCKSSVELQFLDSTMVQAGSSNHRQMISLQCDENRRLHTLKMFSDVKSSSLPDLCFSERDTILGPRWHYPKKEVRYVTRDASAKESNGNNETGRLYSVSIQPHVDAISLTEFGVNDRNADSALGWTFKSVGREMSTWQRRNYIHQALARLSSDTENPFKQNVNLKWLLDWHFVSLESVKRFQRHTRYGLYPASLKDYWKHVGSDSSPSVEESMAVEWMRLQTFQNYPSSAHGSPSRIAREGFYYTGQGTQTRCFSCGVTHGEWNYFDHPHEVHQRLSPNCPFLNGRQERYTNIPISYEGSGYIGGAVRNSIPPPFFPVAPSNRSGTRTGEIIAEGSRSESREGPQASNALDKDDIIRQQQNTRSGETTPSVLSHPVEESAQSEADNRPKFPENVTLPSRIATFSHGWPPYLDQTPQQMAEAGFFFTGNQDYTRCYHCGGGLRNWEPGDNPWIEHCRWYPTCPHVQKGKGQRFVNAVLKKQAELLATQRAESRRKAHYGISSTDPLETFAAITLLEMGYPRDTVRNSILILRRQREPGAEITAQEVLDFIWKEEDIERQRQEEEASRPRHPGDVQPPALPTLMERLNLGGLPAVTQVAVQQSSSITTSTSSISSAAMMVTSVTVAISSTAGTSSITSVSTPALASGPPQSTNRSGQGQQQDEGQGHSTSVGGNGNKRRGLMQGDGVSDGSVEVERAAQNQNQEEAEKGEQRPSGAEVGQSEGPGANAQAIATAIDEDEEFHSLDPEEMENKDYEELEQENLRLKEQTTCKICMENPIRVIFLPCGHLVCCESCAPAFRKCPICRKHIQQSVKTFL